MKKHKTKIIVAIVILIALTGTWFVGASQITVSNYNASVVTAAMETYAYSASDEYGSDVHVLAQTTSLESITEAELIPPPLEEAIETDAQETGYEDNIEYDKEREEASGETLYPSIFAEEEISDLPLLSDGEAYFIADESETQILGADHPYMREPVEPEDMLTGDDSFTVTLSVRADTILHNMHLLHRDKQELVPSSGMIFPATVVTAYEGESVFNVLQREMRRHGIHMSSRFTPIFNSAYVEAINNLYEFDVGPLSGWMYSVNGWFPNFGSSRYLLSSGDVVEWVFTVDLGRDLGVYWVDEDLQGDG